MKHRLPSLTAMVAAAALVACGDSPTASVNNVVTLKATMNFASETPTPPVTSTGSGTFTATLDTVTNEFIYDLTFTGLTSAVNHGHIHGPADVGGTASPTIDFVSLPGATFSLGATSGTGHGVAVLSSSTIITSTINGDSLKKLLLAGKTYANIHTTSNPNGEIRGQITKQP